MFLFLLMSHFAFGIEHMAKNRSIPALATCPSCRRVMEIKSVTPKLRGSAETIEYTCPHCGTTQRRDAPRADNEENHPA
jgi:hypothetical protein